MLLIQFTHPRSTTTTFTTDWCPLPNATHFSALGMGRSTHNYYIAGSQVRGCRKTLALHLLDSSYPVDPANLIRFPVKCAECPEGPAVPQSQDIPGFSLPTPRLICMPHCGQLEPSSLRGVAQKGITRNTQSVEVCDPLARPPILYRPPRDIKLRENFRPAVA